MKSQLIQLKSIRTFLEETLIRYQRLSESHGLDFEKSINEIMEQITDINSDIKIGE